jgi:hypothetical protein
MLLLFHFNQELMFLSFSISLQELHHLNFDILNLFHIIQHYLLILFNKFRKYFKIYIFKIFFLSYQFYLNNSFN